MSVSGTYSGFAVSSSPTASHREAGTPRPAPAKPARRKTAPTPKDDLLTYQTAAPRLKVSVAHLRRLVAQGIVKCVRLGHRTVRFRPAEIDKCLARMEGREE